MNVVRDSSLRWCQRVGKNVAPYIFVALTLALMVTLILLGFLNHTGSSPLWRNCPRDEIVSLPELEMDSTWMYNQKIFFTETSNRGELNPKEACAVESAARRNPDMPSVVVFLSSILSLASNATCQLYDGFSERRVFFRTVRPETILAGSPLEGMNRRLWGTKHWAPHMSDVLRLALVNHFGGWFSDLDMVFLRPLSHLPRNSISSGQSKKWQVFSPTYNGTIGRLVNGAIFHFDRGQPYLLETMKAINETYDPENYISVGPLALTSALKVVCNTTEEEELALMPFGADTHPPERCKGLHLLPQYIFYPAGYVDVLEFYAMLKPSSKWEDFFEKSYVVHMYSSRKAGQGFPMPWLYSKNLPAYLHLAKRNCPTSLTSNPFF